MHAKQQRGRQGLFGQGPLHPALPRRDALPPPPPRERPAQGLPAGGPGRLPPLAQDQPQGDSLTWGRSLCLPAAAFGVCGRSLIISPLRSTTVQVWTVAQVINFKYVPPAYRVLFGKQASASVTKTQNTQCTRAVTCPCPTNPYTKRPRFPTSNHTRQRGGPVVELLPLARQRPHGPGQQPGPRTEDVLG